MKLFSFFFLNILFSFIHADHVAEYSYQLNDGQLNLKFVIEKAEINNFNFNSDCDLKKMTSFCIAKYINEKSHVKINGKIIDFELDNSYTEKYHLVIKLSSKVDSGSIKDLIISNSCFYEFNKKFKNRIILDIDQYQKSYLLTKKKNEIHLN